MAKNNFQYICQQCGYKAAKWSGKCPACGTWNSLTEEVISKNKASGLKSKTPEIKAIHELQNPELFRIITTDAELNRVSGGGLVPGCAMLLGGEPGIGKSTLLLQLAVTMKGKFLYISGEESESQIKMRADRIGILNEECLVVSATSLELILAIIDEQNPDILIIDSVQTLQSEKLESAPGTVSQIRECTMELISLAKSRNIPLFLIGHITKEGYIAGPKVLEHMVDTVLQFEGDRHHHYRMLRCSKNRFGSTAEIGIYEMNQGGLRQVENPSEILISNKTEQLSGIALGSVLEGNRPLLVEAQALVSTAVYGTPQRNSNGFDLRRLNMLLAVLEKRCGFRLAQQDVFINLAGGLKIEDPALDLPLCAAILSSHENIPLPYDYVFAGEIGLSGEVRPVSRSEARIAEAAKLGFKKIFLSANLEKLEKKYPEIEIINVKKLEDVFQYLFG